MFDNFYMTVNPKTEKKAKIASLQKSISNLETQITLFKEEGNTVARESAERLKTAFELMITQLKKS
jgi:hypothetical protein